MLSETHARQNLTVLSLYMADSLTSSQYKF